MTTDGALPPPESTSSERPQSPPAGLTAAVIKYFRICILAVAALIIGGIGAFLALPRAEDPEFDTTTTLVVTLWPGVIASKIEDLVTRPLEEAIDELEDIKRVESTSSSSLSLITVVFAAEADIPEAIDALKQKLMDVRRRLPDGVYEPEVISGNTASIPVIIASLHGPDDYNLLEEWAEKLEELLSTVDKVSSVNIEGMPERQIQVLVDNERLSQYRIPLTRIRDVLSLENAGIPGGKLDVGRRRYLLKNPNEYQSLEEIGQTVLGGFGGSVVLLRDVAEVVRGFADRQYVVRTNRRPALLLCVEKQERTNTVAVAQAVRAELAEFSKRLPDGLELTVVSDRGRSVDELLSNLQSNALGGGLIVIVMVTLFLGVRQATVVSISIPLSVLIAFILMQATAIDLNQISIFGLVLALGMLVDSALVVVENIAIHLERGEALFGAVVSAVDEVKMPVVSSALTTVAAFVPMLFLTGDIGSFIAAMPLTLMYSLAGSLVVAITVVPLLCFAMWKYFPPREIEEEKDTAAIRFYLEIAKKALRNRFLTLAVAVIAFVASVLTIPRLGLQFFPKAEKKFFLINIRLPKEASLEATDLITSQVEEILANEANIRDFTANVGKGSPRIYYNERRENETPSYAQVLVNLKSDFGGSVEAYVDEVKMKLRQVSGASVEPKILEQGPAAGAAIQIRVAGDDLGTLSDLAQRIRRRIEDVPGLADLRDTLGERIPRLVVNLDKRKAALLGIDTFSFSHTVFMALNGQRASMFREGDEEIPLVVRLSKDSVEEVSDLNLLYFPSRLDGSMVPFAEVARVEEEGDFAQISRRDGRRLVTVESDVGGGRLASEIVNDIQERLVGFELPSGYELELGGESEEREESFAGLGQAMGLALLLIYGILAIQFNSFVQPFVILLTVPFGVIGAVFGLLITGNPFGFMAFIGIVSLTGIIINDSIVLTDFTNYLQRVEGKRMYESLLEAGRRRFRPVVLTSVTTIAGMAPLAIWGGSLWSPLACALIFGLGASTVLILVILPVIYSLLVHPKERERTFRLWSRIWQQLTIREGHPGPMRRAR